MIMLQIITIIMSSQKLMVMKQKIVRLFPCVHVTRIRPIQVEPR